MALTFGHPLPGVEYTERRAAYVVILSVDGSVAMIKERNRFFLPGGGMEPGETPEETVIREVREELALSVRLIRTLGEATQYFYSAACDRYYRMKAIFFRGEFTFEPAGGSPEHELEWVPVDEVEDACFHASHAWAIRHS